MEDNTYNSSDNFYDDGEFDEMGVYSETESECDLDNIDNTTVFNKYKKKVLESLDYEDIMSTIPSDYSEEPEKYTGLIEWRWRFLKIKGKVKVEISRLDPKIDKREYLNMDGKWVFREIDQRYDRYVIRKYHTYVR